MKSPAEIAEEKAANWKPPAVKVGDMVYHHAEPGSDGSAAIVTQIGNRAIAVLRFEPGNMGGVPIDGVRHHDDPRAHPDDYQEHGLWSHRE